MSLKENNIRNYISKLNNILYLDFSLFKDFNDYVKKCDISVRSSHNKYLKNNFNFKRLYIIGPEEQEQIYNIWTSTNKRQNRPINFFYEKIEGNKEEIKINNWPIKDYLEYTFPNNSLEFYAIYKDSVIIAYLELLITNKIAVVHSTLGHFDYLKFGIMKALFLEVIKLKWNNLDKLIYGNQNQKDFFKSDLLIESC